MTAPASSCYKCQSDWCEEHNPSSLPEWIEGLKIGNNCGKAYEALTIALEALRKSSEQSILVRISGNLDTAHDEARNGITIAEEALRRIRELGETK